MIASDMYGTMMMMVLVDGAGRMGWGWDGWCKWSQKTCIVDSREGSEIREWRKKDILDPASREAKS